MRCFSKSHKPWIAHAILKSIKKQHHYIKNLHDSSPELKCKFTKYKNNLTSIIRSVEKYYYSDKFDSSCGNIRRKLENIETIINGSGPNKNKRDKN